MMGVCYSVHFLPSFSPCFELRNSDVKNDFFTTDYRFAEIIFLLIIQMSLLFETTDLRHTGQACAKSHAGVT